MQNIEKILTTLANIKSGRFTGLVQLLQASPSPTRNNERLPHWFGTNVFSMEEINVINQQLTDVPLFYNGII